MAFFINTTLIRIHKKFYELNLTYAEAIRLAHDPSTFFTFVSDDILKYQSAYECDRLVSLNTAENKRLIEEIRLNPASICNYYDRIPVDHVSNILARAYTKLYYDSRNISLSSYRLKYSENIVNDHISAIDTFKISNFGNSIFNSLAMVEKLIKSILILLSDNMPSYKHPSIYKFCERFGHNINNSFIYLRDKVLVHECTKPERLILLASRISKLNSMYHKELRYNQEKFNTHMAYMALRLSFLISLELLDICTEIDCRHNTALFLVDPEYF